MVVNKISNNIESNNISIESLKKMILQKKSDLNIAKTVLKSNIVKFDIDESIFEDSKNINYNNYCTIKNKEDEHTNNIDNINNITKENNNSNNEYKDVDYQASNKTKENIFTNINDEEYNGIKNNNNFCLNNVNVNNNNSSNSNTNTYNNLYYNTIGGNFILNIENKANLVHLIDPTILNRINLSSKEKDDLEKNIKKVDKFRIMLSALKNKKIAEIAFFFFNTICDKFYIIPALGSDESKVLHLFYERHYKELSVMTGVISHMLSYLSFIFNINLRYPMLVNGSKAYIVKNKKDFLSLSYSYKGENRAAQFEVALNCLHLNIYEVLKFLKYSMIAKSNSIFKDFIKFYELCMEVILRNKQVEDSDEAW